MDLLVPCIVEGRSELRNIGRVNCKTHWPNIILGCGTPHSLNVYIACSYLSTGKSDLLVTAARSAESAFQFLIGLASLPCLHKFCLHRAFSIFSPINSVLLHYEEIINPFRREMCC
jgi:hypothetical protein